MVPIRKAAFRVRPIQSQYPINQDAAFSKKNVRFNDHIEETRLFFRADPPLSLTLKSAPAIGGAISTGLTYSKHFQISHERRFCILNSTRSAPSTSQPIRLERLLLSPADQYLRGTAAVLNVALPKAVLVWFTFDDWKSASYAVSGYRRSLHLGNTLVADLFGFTINRENLPLETWSVLQVCACYRVLCQDFWDDNGGMNYQITLKL